MTGRVGVVGAGAAGVGAAYAIAEAGADAEVTILEKGGGVGGRAATRRRRGCRYDHGANYVKNADERTASLIPELGAEGLVNVEEPVWTFDAAGELSEGDAAENAPEKWTWTEGIAELGTRLLDRTDADVRTRTRVETVAREDDGWTLSCVDGETFGPFDAILLTPPAPQTAALLDMTHWDDDRLDDVRRKVSAVPYRTVKTVVLHYPFREEYPWYGLVNADKEHEIGWLSREECKDGHVPEGESLFVAQMSPEWSAERYAEPVEEVAPAAAGHVAELLGDDRYRAPDWTDDQGWRLALPDEGVDEDVIRSAEDAGLYFAGDWVAGEGRVHRALWNGYDAGERIAESI
ncbi:NAD(P)/FAD-dependent oxidoreductase [Halopelagius fulvigenes]|uniref:NAD(P)/FAD-dependent oxidoreductase n=1 Tax=Halopelagius fulvigenes TaxID=1198324 RepID=A0ABD5TUE6_9EURY